MNSRDLAGLTLLYLIVICPVLLANFILAPGRANDVEACGRDNAVKISESDFLYGNAAVYSLTAVLFVLTDYDKFIDSIASYGLYFVVMLIITSFEYSWFLLAAVAYITGDQTCLQPDDVYIIAVWFLSLLAAICNTCMVVATIRAHRRANHYTIL